MRRWLGRGLWVGGGPASCLDWLERPGIGVIRPAEASATNSCLPECFRLAFLSCPPSLSSAVNAILSMLRLILVLCRVRSEGCGAAAQVSPRPLTAN